MIETISLLEPKEITYNKQLIEMLLKDLNTDYFNRYDFYDLQ